MSSILITGGTGKIGGQLVAHFYKAGWEVITTSRIKQNINKLAERELLSLNECAAIEVIELDFSRDDALNKIKSYFDNKPNFSPEVLVNNVRSLDFLKVNEQGVSDRENLLNEYLVDVVIPYELSIHFSSLPNTPLKSIINISSIYGIVPFNPNLYTDYQKSAPIQYSIAKAATIHLTKELAIRLAYKKIRVNTVSYGGVEGRVSQDFVNRYEKLCPEGVMLTEEQTIGPVAFLSSQNAQGITGHNLVQDGGWSIW